MLTAIALTAATVAGASAGAQRVVLDPPPMVITVHAASTISSNLLTFMLREADEIWRRAGITFVWQVTPLPTAPYLRAIALAPYRPSTVRVIVDDEIGRRAESGVPIGWVIFDDPHAPEPDLHVSRANARRLLATAPSVVGRLDEMPRLQEEILLGRAMGRALAHEMGHYLLASKAHTGRGVMQATLSAWEFFSAAHADLGLGPAERNAAAERIAATATGRVARAQESVTGRPSPAGGRPRT